jgi:hypothetical protein
MSEYQYYEFLALDRPLTQEEMAALRDISSRAVITPTSFTNHCQWGDLKADPLELLRRSFDVFVYVANWGAHRLALRLPLAAIEPHATQPSTKPANQACTARHLSSSQSAAAPAAAFSSSQ